MDRQGTSVGILFGVGSIAVALFLPDIPDVSKPIIVAIGAICIAISVTALLKPDWFFKLAVAEAPTPPAHEIKTADTVPASATKYLADALPGQRIDLWLAFIFITDTSQWHLYALDKLVPDKEKAKSRDEQRLYLAEIAARVFHQHAGTGRLKVWGRPKDAVEYEPISVDTWDLIQLKISPDPHQLLSVVIAPWREEDRKRLARVLSYDALQVDLEQFTQLWPKMEDSTQERNFELGIIVGHGGPYAEAQSYNPVNVTKTVNVGIKNTGNVHLSNCRVMYNVSVWSEPHSIGTWGRPKMLA
jgi:hypothetical protein